MYKKNKKVYKKISTGIFFIAISPILFSFFCTSFVLAADKPQNQSTAQDAYIPLVSLGNVTTQGKPVTLNDYLPKMVTLGIAVASGLAVVMMIFGAVEYMSTDAIFGKEEGKTKITDALIGLLMALCSYLILQTINVDFLNSNLEIEDTVATVTNLELPNLPPPPQPIYSGPNPGVPGLQKPGQTAAQAILASAQYAADSTHPLNTNVPGTDGGNLGCAYAVNEIVESALGRPITNSLGTPDMYQALKVSPYFSFVGSDISQSQPGDIIISPTGAKTGHVGVIETAGGGSIISNSSSAAEVKRNYTAASWTSRYQGTQNLPVYIFRAK